MDSIPLHFIGEEIAVQYSKELVLEKTPRCPDGFTWREEGFCIKSLLAEWRDYTRKGRMARNMTPAHASVAASRGSWGVGRFFFRVEVNGGRIFDIYYDREPGKSSDRKGHWFLLGERMELKRN